MVTAPATFFSALAEVMLDAMKRRVLRVEKEMAKGKLREGDPTVCPATLEDHALVTFHSAPKEERFVCIDCGVKFRDDDAILTRHKRRSTL